MNRLMEEEKVLERLLERLLEKVLERLLEKALLRQQGRLLEGLLKVLPKGE